MNPLKLLLLLAIAMGALLPLPAQATEYIASDNDITTFRHDEYIMYSPASYEALDQFSRGHADKAYAAWVEEAWKGDFDAMALAAMICVMEERSRSPEWKVQWGKPGKAQPICPVPAKFWEDVLVNTLGEGEGTMLLGLFGMELMDQDPFRKEAIYAAPIEAYMLRSAMAGNASGMYGAYYTGENRRGQFTPPAGLPDVPVLPEKYTPGFTFEQRYWLTQAAHAGNAYSMRMVALKYRGKSMSTPDGSPDFKKQEEYLIMAIEHGSSLAAQTLASFYVRGLGYSQNPKKAIYYQAIGALLKENGELITEKRDTNPLGYSVRIIKEGFMEGDLSQGGTRFVFEPCLTEAEYQEAITEAWPVYEKAKLARDQIQAAQDALYAAARAKLPEIRTAYQKAVEAKQTE